jgi:hypothetical protein
MVTKIEGQNAMAGGEPLGDGSPVTPGPEQAVQNRDWGSLSVICHSKLNGRHYLSQPIEARLCILQG